MNRTRKTASLALLLTIIAMLLMACNPKTPEPPKNNKPSTEDTEKKDEEVTPAVPEWIRGKDYRSITGTLSFNESGIPNINRNMEIAEIAEDKVVYRVIENGETTLHALTKDRSNSLHITFDSVDFYLVADAPEWLRNKELTNEEQDIALRTDKHGFIRFPRMNVKNEFITAMTESEVHFEVLSETKDDVHHLIITASRLTQDTLKLEASIAESGVILEEATLRISDNTSD